MQLTVISPGKTKKDYLAAAIDDFLKRLNASIRCTTIYTREIPARAKTPDRLILEQEGRARQGRQYSSGEMAQLLGRWEEEGRRSITFLIGGHLGLSGQVLDRADMLLSFSRMTFTHEMTRLLLLEQLYRACTIRQGTGYHK